MASRPSSSGADAAEAFAAYAAMAGIDLVAPTTSPWVPTASPLDDTPATGVGIDAEPPVLGEPSATALPSSGSALEVETAAPPASGEPTAGEEDIAPLVMGVPSSSEDERIRQDVLEELREMVEDASDDTAAWVGDPARPRVGYPVADDLRQDVDAGFDMLGPVRSARGWRRRSDERYARPKRLENPLYVARKAARPGTRSTPDRFSTSWWRRLAWAGSQAPDHWSVSTVALPSVADMGVLRQPPTGDCFAALSFAICQVDENGELKLRRGEDWRRSGHNATMGASDVPTHHFLGDIVDLVLRWAVRHPGHCGAFLPSASGVTLWFHFAMCFGAAASVWNFNRAADAVQMLLRSLLLVLLGHFVDDFNGVDAADLADSAHHAVADFFALLGLQTKPSKAQAPAKRHVVQGVELSIRPEGVELSPTAQRTQKILGQIDGALARDIHLWSDRAGGHQAALFQGGNTAANSDDALSVGLRAALGALRRLVASCRPRLVPWPGRVTGPFPVLYADAFFLDGDLRKKPGHLAAGEAVPRAARWQNGWGYVLLLDGHVFYDYGVVKPEHLAPFAARKAFIYVLEIVAQVLPLVTFARRLSPFWIAFIDNDISVNGILASFWGLAADHQWSPDFHRVPSASNVSDAISRGDDSRARTATPVDDIMDVLCQAARDIEFACHAAPERLLDLAVW
ncbi:PUB3 [Symbiodinium microadriaticum]|nr:PUB3 [Symbiodinium microadriaticum]